MPNTFLYKVNFITDDFYLNTYNTAFSEAWNNNSDNEKVRFTELASTRIKSLASRPFVELTDLEFEQGEGVQIATARLIDYWMEYGLDLNRISGSVSLGSFSASQTVPSDPDYIPKHVFDVLQDVGLYSPIGFVTDDIYRADDDREVTYGVRFKTLERIKEVSLDKTVAEDANKNLAVPTVGKVLEDIRNAKLSPFAIIGQITEPTGATVLPTEAELEALFVSGAMVLDDGTKILQAYTDPTNPAFDEHVPVTGEAIRVYLSNGVQEITDFDGTAWRIDNSKNAANAQTNANAAALAELNGLTQLRAIKAVEGDTRYIRTDGSNEMAAGYTPTEAKSVTTKEYVDSANAAWAADVATNTNDISTLIGRVDVIEPIATANQAQVATNVTAIAKNATDITTNAADIVTLKATDVSLDGRIEAIEQAGFLDDKVWEGSIAGADSVDLSAIVDQNGGTFDFSDGKILEVVIEKVSASLEQGHDLTIGKTNATPYVIGQRSFTAKLDNTGHLTMVETGAGDLSDFNVVKVLEAASVTGVSNVYTKSESDAKYGTKTEIAANTAKINTNITHIASISTVSNTNKAGIATLTTNVNTVITDVATKQDSTDASLQTTDKNIVKAINEVKHVADAADAKSTANDQIDTTTLVALETKLGV